MTTKTDKKNCLLIYGGGLCDPANVFLREYARFLHNTGMFGKVFIGFYSFSAMLNTSWVQEWDDSLKDKADNSHGGFFGTSRGIDLTNSVMQEQAIQNCKALGISWVFVAGGDGSSRQVSEIADAFEKEGIKFAFVMPCTIDGINGGQSIGMRQAVEVSLKVIEQLSATCLQTLEGLEFPVLIVELQGRNRDDILASVLKRMCSQSRFDYPLGISVDIFAVPANYEWNREALLDAVNKSHKPTLILMSEGASIKRRDLKKLIARKCRTFEVAHLSQMNGCTNEDDATFIRSYIVAASVLWKTAVTSNKPFTIVYEKGIPRIEEINYFANLNPRVGQKAKLPPGWGNIIKSFVAS